MKIPNYTLASLEKIKSKINMNNKIYDSILLNQLEGHQHTLCPSMSSSTSDFLKNAVFPNM